MKHGHVTGKRRGSYKNQAWYKAREKELIAQIDREWQARQQPQTAQHKAA